MIEGLLIITTLFLCTFAICHFFDTLYPVEKPLGFKDFTDRYNAELSRRFEPLPGFKAVDVQKGLESMFAGPKFGTVPQYDVLSAEDDERVTLKPFIPAGILTINFEGGNEMTILTPANASQEDIEKAIEAELARRTGEHACPN